MTYRTEENEGKETDSGTLNERAIKIINYIKENPGTTENKVVLYMDEKSLCSRLTTLKEIDSLVSREIIEDRKEGNSFHRLHANNQNEFNRIDLEITEIETIMDEMDEPLRKLSQISMRENELADRANLRVNFHYPYRDSVGTILQILLLWTSTKIRSKNYSQILYTRIMKLMLKLTLQTFNLNDPTNLLDNEINSLNQLKHSKTTVAFAKKNTVNIGVASNLIKKIENFNRRFLKESN